MADMTGKEATTTEGALAAFERARLGIWAFLATELLLFGGLFTTYTVYRVRYQPLFHEQHLHLNRAFGAVNTVILICSSLSVAIGIAAIKSGKQAVLKLCLAITLLLAASFLFIKYIEYSEHIAQGELPSSNLFSLYYMTGLRNTCFRRHGRLAAMLTDEQGAFSENYSTPSR
jgi:cytochrome c oxidase subunit 3